MIAPAVSGIVLGYVFLTAVVALGIGPLIAAVPLAMTAITLAGAAYLIHVGIRTLRSAVEVHGAAAIGPLAAHPRGYLLRGAMVSGLNPKSGLLFLAILPQFAHASTSWSLPTQMAVLGGIYMAITAVFSSLLGLTADRVLGARPVIARATTRVSGAAMVLAGIALLVEKAIHTL